MAFQLPSMDHQSAVEKSPLPPFDAIDIALPKAIQAIENQPARLPVGRQL